MSLIAILIILASVAMMLGPIMLMQPSSRQQQLTLLRAKALDLGLKVQLKSYDNQTCAEYTKPWSVPENSKIRHAEWALVKKKYAHDIHFFNEWDWEDGQSCPAELSASLRALLPALPSGVNCVRVNKLGVSLTWNESGGVEALSPLAEQIHTLSSELASFYGGS